MDVRQMTALLVWSSQAVGQRLTPIPPTLGTARQSNFQPETRASTSPWTPLTNQPSFLAQGAANPILLTDDTVLVQDAGSQDWWRLTPG